MAGVALAALLLAGGAGAEKVYRWTDAEGRIHFGDQPRQGAQAVDIRTVRTVTFERLDRRQGGKALRPDGLVMYSTEWCGFCRKARQYFRREGIAYREKDIEASAAARREYEKLGGKGVPFFVRGGVTMSGFNVPRFRQFMEMAGD